MALLEQQLAWRDPAGRFPYTIQGRSWARVGTGFYVPELGLLIDVGWPTNVQPRAVLLTHTHPDHCRHVNEAAINRADSFNLFCPPEAVEPLQGFLTAFARLRACTTHIKWNWELSQAKLVPLAPDDGWVPLATVSKASVSDVPEPQLRKRKRRRENQLKALAAKPKLAPGSVHPGAPKQLQQLVVRACKLRHSVVDNGYVVARRTKRVGHPELITMHAEYARECELAEAGAKGPAEAKALLAELKQAHTARMQAFAIAAKKAALETLAAEPTPALEAAIAAGLAKLPADAPPHAAEAVRKRALHAEAKRTAQSQMNVVHYAPLLAVFLDCCSDSGVAAIDDVCRGDTKPAVIMVECTYVDDADAALAVRNRHVLWSKLRPATQRNPDVTFLLVHFSTRYSIERLKAFAVGLDPNVHAFFESPPDVKPAANGGAAAAADGPGGGAGGLPAGHRGPPGAADGGAGAAEPAV